MYFCNETGLRTRTAGILVASVRASDTLLQESRRAEKLAPSQQKSILAYQIGQCLQTLGRAKEAKVELLKFVEGEALDSKDAVVALYTLCLMEFELSTGSKKQTKKDAAEFYHRAVEREKGLSIRLQKMCDGNCKMTCQAIMAAVPAKLDDECEWTRCAHCGDKGSKLLRCGGCKRIQFCSKECQVGSLTAQCITLTVCAARPLEGWT